MESWEDVFEHYGWKCVYCDAKLTRDFRLHVSSGEGAISPEELGKTDCIGDHVYPTELGGADCFANRVATCPQCNAFKGNYVDDEFRGIATTPEGEKYIEEALRFEYRMGIIEHIIQEAEAWKDRHLKVANPNAQEALTQLADAYIKALREKLEELQVQARLQNEKQKQIQIYDD